MLTLVPRYIYGNKNKNSYNNSCAGTRKYIYMGTNSGTRMANLAPGLAETVELIKAFFVAHKAGQKAGGKPKLLEAAVLVRSCGQRLCRCVLLIACSAEMPSF